MNALHLALDTESKLEVDLQVADGIETDTCGRLSESHMCRGEIAPTLRIVDQAYLAELGQTRFRVRRQHVSVPPKRPVGAKAPVVTQEQSEQALGNVRVARTSSLLQSRTLPLRSLVRLFVRGVLAVLIAAGLGAGAAALVGSEQWEGPIVSRTVSAGETLWSIAEGLDLPQVSQDEKLTIIRQLNNMTKADIQVGQTLVLPAHQ